MSHALPRFCRGLGAPLLFSLALGGLSLAPVLHAGGAAWAGETVSSIARGGRLYDDWFTETKAAKPETTHPAWPASNDKKSGAVTWRCKSCHGWDLMGKDGAYATGSYKTGIGGLTAFAGGDPAAVIAVMKDPSHGFDGLMAEQDFTDLANFVTQGQFDIDAVINRADKTANGDAEKGAGYYNTVCAGCHGRDGKLPKDMDVPLGKLAPANPWEVIHKVLNGQAGEAMPAMRAFGVPVAADILAHLQTLPQE